jgi:hypothetical protein
MTFQILLDGEIRIAEVYFFICIHGEDDNSKMGLALVSIYSRPHPSLLQLSANTLWSCEHRGDASLRFIDVKMIQAVVAMVPHRPAVGGRAEEERYFMVEKPGFDVAVMAGVDQETPENEGELEGGP